MNRVRTAANRARRRRHRRSASEPEQVAEPDRQAWSSSTTAHREEHAGHEARPVQRVVPDRERLALQPEDHLLVRDQTRQPHRVHVHAARRSAAPRRRRRSSRSVGSAAQSPAPAASRAACMRRMVSSDVPDGRVPLTVVMELDDLRAGHERGAELGAAHHQGGPDGEVRRHDGVRLARRTSSRRCLEVALVEPVVPHTACTPWSAHQRRLSRAAVGDGEVDRHLGAGREQRPRARRRSRRPLRVQAGDIVEPATCCGRVDGGDELEVARSPAPPRRPPLPCARLLRTPLRASRHHRSCWGKPPASGAEVSRYSGEVGLDERPDHRQGPRAGQHLLGGGIALRRR